jgi:hypothetical protein
MTASAMGLFFYEYLTDIRMGIDPALALAESQTVAVTTIILFQAIYLLNCRSLTESIFRIGLFSNMHVYYGIATALVLQFCFVYAASIQRAVPHAPAQCHGLDRPECGAQPAHPPRGQPSPERTRVSPKHAQRRPVSRGNDRVHIYCWTLGFGLSPDDARGQELAIRRPAQVQLREPGQAEPESRRR